MYLITHIVKSIKPTIMITLVLIGIGILLSLGVIWGLYMIYGKNTIFADIFQKETKQFQTNLQSLEDKFKEGLNSLKENLTPEKIKEVVTESIAQEMERIAAEQAPDEDEEQVDLGTFVKEAIVSAFQEDVFNEENIKNLQTMLADTIKQVISENPVSQFMGKIDELTPEQLKDVDYNVGATVVNLISSINPILPELLNKVRGEGWKEEIQENPQIFMALVDQLQQRGILNWVESFSGRLSPPHAITGTPASIGTPAGNPIKRNKTAKW